MWQFPYYTPGHALPWEQMDRELDWLREMRGVPQDPVWHGEGDVHTHTRMVAEALTELGEFQALPADRQHMLLAAALLHDVEKRSTTVTELIEGEERITAPGHARRGAQTARDWLYRACPAPFAVREAIVQLVRLHALPLHAIEKPDPRQAVITASCLTDTALLGLLARADVLGRIAPDQEKLLLHAALFEELCKEHECYGQARAFPSAYGRWLYLNRDGYAPDYEPYEDHRFEVVILSGLPGAGKDRYLRQLPDLPVISLDDIRRELKIDPADRRRNGQAVQLGKERARELLRRRQGFVFNATNVTAELRGIWISLCLEYKARVRIVYIEVPYRQLLRQNAEREHPVPASTLERLILKLEPPTVLEAHTVEHITEG
ncbi:MAG: AAA family ATPase [Bacteroidia bacterium]|nr:AAA family ATPase [Bacteroidia bacterium]